MEARPACPVCKKGIKKTIKVYLTIASSGSSSCQNVQEHDAAVASVKENSRVQQRLRELQQLSNDQSDLLLRILPRYDRLEERHGALKREKKRLKQQLEAVEDENWELLFDCFDAQAKLKEANEERNDIEIKLEETVDENKDLFAIWEALEKQLETSMVKKKEVKAKLKERLREQREELDLLKTEVDRNMYEKSRLKGDLELYQEELSKLKKKMKLAGKSVKRRTGRGKARRTLRTYSGVNFILSS